MKIEIPEQVRDCEVIASVSGGKDSAALVLALREAEISARYVFADTGWEHPHTYAHLDTMRARLGIQIDVVGLPGGMAAEARRAARFPGRMQRWCTRKLKLEPLRAYHDAVIDETGEDTINAMGVRADESAARAKMPAWGEDREWGGWAWRPLLTWTVQDVLEIHRRHNLPMNPLYHAGANRVGCWPCIYSGREELRTMAAIDPGRVDLIETLEADVTAARQARGLAGRATFYQSRDRSTGEPQGIRDVIGWAKADIGGRQQLLFEPAPTGGCMRWGLCETTPPPPAPQPK